MPTQKQKFRNQEQEQADKALGRFYFDTNVMVILLAKELMGE